MRAAARLLEGRHDFAAFQAAGSSVATTVREIVMSTISTTEDAVDIGGKNLDLKQDLTSSSPVSTVVES